MSVSPATAALTFVALAVLMAGAWAWLIAALKAAVTWGWIPQPLAANVEAALVSAGLLPRLPLVSWSPRRPVPWAFVDLLALVGVWIVASLAVSATLRQLGWLDAALEAAKLSLDQRKALLVGNTAVSVFIIGIGLPLIALRTGATLRDFGWSWRDFASDLRLGVIGFVMLAPPVYALQGLLVYFWQPSKHPLMEMFKAAPDAWFFVMLLVSAAVVAPLLEELIFRVVQQGYLEKWFTFRYSLHELFFGRASLGPEWASPDAAAIAPPLAPPDDNPYAPPMAVIAVEEVSSPTDDSPVQLQPAGLAAWLPIAISSAVFALLHYSHGPDWIPLLILAAGMGYLYQRTHRLVPSLVVHVLLNGMSLWGLWVQVQEGFSS